MPRLLFVPGSLREASSSRALARTLAARLQGQADIHTADIGTLPLYDADIQSDPQVDGFIAAVKAADGVVFVTPEYNYSVPGVLKNAIDWASRPSFDSVFKDKRCFVITVSGGALGGARAQGHLKYILNAMLARVFPCKEVVVPLANEKVTDGAFTDEAVLSFAEENLCAFLDTLT